MGEGDGGGTCSTTKKISEEEQTYECPKCGYEQTFGEAYMDSGHYCPNCNARLDIPLTYWRR